MSMIQVTSQQLRDKAAELRQQNNHLKSQIENLSAQENSLSGMWEGEARESFRNAFKTDVQKMQQFITAIEQYATALVNIAQEYDTAEAKNVSTASTRTV